MLTFAENHENLVSLRYNREMITTTTTNTTTVN